MIGRVTQQTVQRSTLANLQTNLSAMAALQGKLSSTKNITRPSDDPAGTSSAIALRSALRANEQHARNISDGDGWLTNVDSALRGSLDALRQARDLTVQGSNQGVLNAQAREALAVEIEGLRDALLNQANTSYLGRSVFAGTSDAASAVTVDTTTTPPSYTSTSVTGASVERRIDANTLVRVDVDGALAFGEDDPVTGTGSVFSTLDRIAAKLRANEPVSGELTTLDEHRDAMLGQLTAVGARQSQVQTAKLRALDTKTELAGRLSTIEDVDLPGTIIELQMQEVAYKSALGAASRVLQPSLMDYLR
ncbi:flagellar hook-associated protein FlgL [Cellulomonas fimi]|uniref:Flagellar hook-associated protein FlgL n=1 Tax=Cellulomonas fimi TaxID=1708 RepID=A0A7Y0LZK8_CELFI|nr:flagellar hook-associated protein FlgL [Cellulomonas fimi]NMR21025.1 flagellar hook-associated protein FlgL [Cellulomonas fimi]